ncbi:helicase MOV-10-like [Phlebotomus argentipes]|uniref:helicase MOV-10-like n=1 Tax=Phlebotomus argentipes TaxID=94469 RepID=UPI002892C709|nr:helicase MOV-10-like [Phlebotomus argentipes]
MAQKSSSSANMADAMRENVEKLLAKLFIAGTIENNLLHKKDLRKAVVEFAAENKLKNFGYKNVQNVMFKDKLTQYMIPSVFFKSPFFRLNTWKIEKFVKKYVQEEEGFSYDLAYFATIQQERNYVLTDENKTKCFECKETFENYPSFLDHMKTHDKDFAAESSKWSKQLIELTMECQDRYEQLVFNINSNKSEVKISMHEVILLQPDGGSFFSIATYEEDDCIKFSINRCVLTVENQPYSIILISAVNGKFSVWTHYHFTLVNKVVEEEPIKVKCSVAAVLPKGVPRTILTILPSYHTPQEMKSLTKKMSDGLEDNELTEPENTLLDGINDLLAVGPTKANYKAFWQTLVDMENCEKQERIAKMNQYDVNLTSKITRHGIFYLLENIHNADSSQLPEKTEVRIKLSKKSYGEINAMMIGTVHQVRKKDIVLDVEIPFGDETLYDVFFSPNRVPSQLQKEALEYVDRHMIAKFFFPDSIPTHPIDFSGFEWINDSVKENPEQQSAIIHMVEKSSFPAPYILMGPPGTGKTTTIVEAVCQITRRKPEAKILIATTSNNATDVITLRLLKYFTKEEILRFFSKSKAEDMKTIDPEVVRASNLKYTGHYYPSRLELYKYRVVLTTLVTAGRLAQMKIDVKGFSYVFIDECGSGTEASTLIPIARVVSSLGEIHAQVILAGDPKQLGPVVMAEKVQPRLGISMLERLVDSGIYAKDPETGKYNPRAMTKLLRNYRSHPKILEFPNDAFYDGDLIAEADKEIAFWACDWQLLPNPKIPIIFENVEGFAKRFANFPSLFNFREVSRVLFYIKKILSMKEVFGREITQKSIGVISPYKAQCRKITEACARMNLAGIEIGSVEKFQGNEKPVIIFSTVRSRTNSVGFLNNPKRLNVALTRAQALLIIVGNISTLEKDETWKGFTTFCENNNLIKEISKNAIKKAKNTETQQKR